MKKRFFQTPFLLLISIALFISIFSNCSLKTKFSAGKGLYNYYCANCHMENGEGLRDLIPPLANTNYIIDHADELPCLIRNGMDKTIVVNGKTYSASMPGVPELNEVEITNIINYINHSWKNKGEYVKLSEIKTALEACPSLSDDY